MTKTISRRDFIKYSGLGTAASAVLTGCGPVSRYVVRQQYAEMPEFNQTGVSTYYATSCRECPAGCGVIVRTREGRAIGVQGNPDHPINYGKLCSRGLTTLQGLYNPDRLTNPIQLNRKGDQSYTEINWDLAVTTITAILRDTPPDEIVFILGMTPDHLYDLVYEMTQALGIRSPYRFGSLGMFDAQGTLVEAVNQIFNQKSFPYFDFGKSDLVFSFGANFLETWLSPITYSRAYAELRQGNQNQRGYYVSFEPRMSLTSGSADEWIPIIPGSENIVARALGNLVQEMKPQTGVPYFHGVDIQEAVSLSGVSLETLQHLANLFFQASNPICIPGGTALSHKEGLTIAKSILSLNILGDNIGKPGGIYLAPTSPTTNPFSDIQRLTEEMQQGNIKSVFIHGWNPVFELPGALDFPDALMKVANVISFATFFDETSHLSDYVLPDHSPLESWGYQRNLPGADRPIFTSFQPVVSPLYNTRSTTDLLLASVGQMDEEIKSQIPYTDEVDFLQQKLQPLLDSRKGFYQAEVMPAFWSLWLQYGGWWHNEPELMSPSTINPPALYEQISPDQTSGSSDYHLVVYTTQKGDGSQANRPWIQETPDPMTTVIWNSWVEIHPKTAEKLGIHNDDIVEITSEVGKIEAVAYLYPAIRPDTIAIPFGQGHTSFSRYADQRGSNPAVLFELILDQAGGLAFGDTRVSLKPTGKRYPLARIEDQHGIYGDEQGQQ